MVSAIRWKFLWPVALLALGACEAGRPDGGAVANAASGSSYTEPVIYNGMRYAMTFQFKAAQGAYDVQITRRGRRLTDSDADRATALSVVASALSHYACPRGRKAKLLEGTPAHGGGVWRMLAKCA